MKMKSHEVPEIGAFYVLIFGMGCVGLNKNFE